MKQRIVNIIGMGQNARWLPEHGERWGINHCYLFTEWLTKWFIMDGVKAMYESAHKVQKDAIDIANFAANNPEMEIISAYPESIKFNGKLIKTATPYPLDDVIGLIPGPFINSSLTEILAYVCVQEQLGFQKVDQVNLYGIEMWANSEQDEHNYQKVAIDFWIAFLYGRGIQLSVPAYLLYANNCKHNLYGYYRDEPVMITKGGSDVK